MPTTYKGLVIPLSSDLADGPAAFRDYTDSLPASEALVPLAFPVGFLGFTCSVTAPAGWLLLDGTTVAGGQTAYPKLWAVVPVGWQSGADLILPDCRGRIIIGSTAGVTPPDTTLDAIGEKAGAKTTVLTAANLPLHAHTMNHAHGPGVAGGDFVTTRTGEGAYTGGIGGSHDPTTGTFTGNTGNGPGTAAPVSIMPPVIVFNIVIRAV